MRGLKALPENPSRGSKVKVWFWGPNAHKMRNEEHFAVVSHFEPPNRFGVIDGRQDITDLQKVSEEETKVTVHIRLGKFEGKGIIDRLYWKREEREVKKLLPEIVEDHLNRFVTYCVHRYEHSEREKRQQTEQKAQIVNELPVQGQMTRPTRVDRPAKVSEVAKEFSNSRVGHDDANTAGGVALSPEALEAIERFSIDHPFTEEELEKKYRFWLGRLPESLLDQCHKDYQFLKPYACAG